MKEQFVKIISENEGLIFKVCNLYCRGKEDIEDLFQDIILQLWKAYPGFKGDSKISTWMYRVALNTAITRIRKESRREKFEELSDGTCNFAAFVESPEEERLTKMYEAIKKLSEVERALTMLYLDDCSYKEMSEILGISESNIGFKLNKIKTKLRILIKK
ncbi:MAG: sigma-70 family RNA polymerase sigma factor [Sphingobacteriaceae bacterium]|nr:sigma-70 family RNA polymerase sigma factor [Sphingobacteriaceae bacterium]